MDVRKLKASGLYVEAHQSSVAKEPTNLVCEACNKTLMQIPTGGMLFTQTHGRCTCSWGCCETAKPTNRPHPRHLGHRVAAPKLQPGKILTRNHGFADDKKHNAVRSSDSGINYMFFTNYESVSLTDREIRARWSIAGGDPYRHRCSHEHDCCACHFHSEIHIERRRRFVVVTQFWGINI